MINSSLNDINISRIIRNKRFELPDFALDTLILSTVSGDKLCNKLLGDCDNYFNMMFILGFT